MDVYVPQQRLSHTTVSALRGPTRADWCCRNEVHLSARQSRQGIGDRPGARPQ